MQSAGHRRYELVRLASPEDWHAYHRIRREVLFEARGFDGYNSHHPDETAPGSYPVLMKLDDIPIATTRLDVRTTEHYGHGFAIVRLVAVDTPFQRQGHGRVLDRVVAEFSGAKLGVTDLWVFAAPDAVGFYERCGWSEQKWSSAPAESQGVQMVKSTASSNAP